MPESVLIKYDRCRLTLNLPIFFENAALADVRKVFKMIADRPYQNDEAVEVLDQIFPLWRQTLTDDLDRAEAELTAAKQDAESKRRTLAALGSMVDIEISRARQRLASVKSTRAKSPEDKQHKERMVEKATAALALATKPKTDHAQAAKEVKRLEAVIKATKADKERCGKIINAYNIKVNKGE